MHKLPNCFHIFGFRAGGRSPWPVVVFEWCSASLEARMLLETPRKTRGIISIRTSYHFKSLRSRFDEFHAEFGVCCLLQFHVHAVIADVQAHVVTNTGVVQLPMFTKRRHLAYWVATFPAPYHSARIHVLPSAGVLRNQSGNFLIHLRTSWNYLAIQMQNFTKKKKKEIEYLNRILHYILHLFPADLQCCTMQYIHSNLTGTTEFYVSKDPQQNWFILKTKKGICTKFVQLLISGDVKSVYL
jgi:hypothetical protein